MKRIEMGMGRKIVITLALVMAMWGLMLPKMVSMVKASETSVVSEWTQLQNAITNASDKATITVSEYDADKDKTITASSAENSLYIQITVSQSTVLYARR